MAWWVLLVGTAAALFSGTTASPSWHLDPIQLVVFGVLGVAIVNIVVFSLSLFLSVPKWLRAKTEKELTQVAVPALQGEVTEIGRQTGEVVGILVAACIGVVLGGVGAGVWSLLQ